MKRGVPCPSVQPFAIELVTRIESRQAGPSSQRQRRRFDQFPRLTEKNNGAASAVGVGAAVSRVSSPGSLCNEDRERAERRSLASASITGGLGRSFGARAQGCRDARGTRGAGGEPEGWRIRGQTRTSDLDGFAERCCVGGVRTERPGPEEGWGDRDR